MQTSRHVHRLLLFLLALLTGPVPATAFRWVNNVNFTTCYNDIISQMPQNCSDTDNQVCVLDDAGNNLYPGRIFVTYHACERLCGDGYGLWEIKDILLRISLWVIPAIILIVHYHFPPLGPANMTSVIAHLLADPIDTLWCLLTRITARRHLLNKAVDERLLSSGAIATIWSAYDELNFHDPSQHFVDALERLQALEIEVDTRGQLEDLSGPSSKKWRAPRFRDGFLRVDHGRLPDRKGTSKSLEGNAAFSELIESFFKSIEHRFARLRRGAPRPARQLPRYFQAWHSAIRHLDADERPVLYIIEAAAKDLVFNRGDSSLTTWISIFGLMSAMMGAFVRTWSDRLETQTSHTIATVTLMLVVVPIVKLSGNIGSFTSSTAAVHIIQQLRQDLRKHFGSELGPEYELFPPLDIPVLDDGADGEASGHGIHPQVLSGKHHALTSAVEQTEGQAPFLTRSEMALEEKQLLDWPRVAAYSGMNNSYRPNKVSELVHLRWAVGLLLLSVVWILGFCYAPALLISYFTPLKGFACRSLAWTLIMFCWLLTIVTTLTFPLLGLRPRILWRATCTRDLLFTLLIVAIVTAQQLGLYNSCYCRSGELTHSAVSYVNLTPFTDGEFIEGWKMWVPTPGAAFLISIIGIFIIELSFSQSGRLLSRNNVEREKMLLHLRRLAVEPAN